MVLAERPTTLAPHSIPLPTISDDLLISTLVASHGDTNLTAERLTTSLNLPLNTITRVDVTARLPYLPYDLLVSAIKAARLLKAYDAFAIMQEAILTSLSNLPPEQFAKFFIQYLDRFEVMINPPVQGGSGQSPSTSSTNLQFNFGSQEAETDARVELAKRLQSRLVTIVQEDDAGPASNSPD